MTQKQRQQISELVTVFPAKLTPGTVVSVERMNRTFIKYHLDDHRVLHQFTAAHDLHYHDHPFGFKSTILAGGYREEIGVVQANGTMAVTIVDRLPGTAHSVKAGTIHRLVGLLAGDCWTIIEPGPKEKDSGFYKVNEKGVWHRYWYQRKWRLLIRIAK
ncbi:hypothetical protein GCM10028805_25850 [Spirosoma harenae]